jgi:LacI family transcriptional regulator
MTDMSRLTAKKGRASKCERLTQHIREQIRKGRFQNEKFPTEREWMAQFGVSRFTVRQALSELVREELLVRARRRGTTVCTSANSFISNKTANSQIGVLVPSVTYMGSVGMIRAIQDVCSQNGYHLVLGNCDVTPEKEKQCLESMSQHGVSGFIVFPSYNSFLHGYYDELKRRDMPFVFIDGPVEGVQADVIATDNFGGAYEGMKALLAHDCRKVAFLSGYMSAATSRARLAGCQRALTERGMTMDPDLIKVGAFSREFGCQSAKELLAAHKDLNAFFVANEPITIGVLRAIHEAGLNLPRDIRVCSFDEPHHSLDYAFPMILVRQPRYETGKRAAEILLGRIREKRERKERTPAQTILLKAEVIVPPEYSGGLERDVRPTQEAGIPASRSGEDR